jgi:hypothetical protein
VTGFPAVGIAILAVLVILAGLILVRMALVRRGTE